MARTDSKKFGAILGTALAEVQGSDPAKTLPTFLELEERLDELPSDDAWGLMLRGLVHNGGFAAAYAANRFKEALRFAEAECETFRGVSGEEAVYARALNNRGLARLELGDLVGAEDDFRAALAILDRPAILANSAIASSLLRTVRDHLDMVGIMRNPTMAGERKVPGRTPDDIGPPIGAPNFMRFAENRRVRLAQSAAEALGRTAAARSSGRVEEGRQTLQNVVDEARAFGEPRVFGIALSNLGEYLLGVDNTASLAALSESVSVLEQLPLPNEPLALSLHNLSLALSRMKATEAATEAAKRAWLLIQEASPSGPAALSILYNLASLRLAAGDSVRTRAILKHAMSLYDSARRRFAVHEQDHSGTFGLYRALVELMLLVAVDEQWTDEALASIENAKARFLSDYLARLVDRTVPARADEMSAPIPGALDPGAARLKQLSNHLAGPGTFVLNFFTGANFTFVVWSRGSGVGVFRINITESELRSKVEAFYADLQSASLRQPWRESGRMLHAVLFDKIKDQYARGETILVSPDGPLWLLPFDALNVAALPAANAVASIPVYCAFSLHTVELLRELAPMRHPGQRYAVIVAKAEFETQPGLDSTIDEANSIGSHLEQVGFAVTMLQGGDATPPKLLRAMGDAEVIHLATHAVAPADGTEPYVVLDNGEGGDAKLTVKDIVALRLTARVVFLSVCSSAAGADSVGEGVVSIARAFILTGCQSVIASLWPVVAEDSAALAKKFYVAYADNKAPAAALAIAKGSWHDGGPFMRTAAAFQVYGDGEPDYTVSDFVSFVRKQNLP